MTAPLLGQDLANQIREQLPGSVIESFESTILVKSEALLEVSRFLKTTPGLDFDYLVSITGVDYLDYFEVVYHLVSLTRNHSIILKTRSYDRENPTLPSVTPLWRGADFQEREVYDLMGIVFSGHPNLKRIFLWDGFQRHPLRKDYL